MLRWIVLLGVLMVGLGVLWNTRPPPRVSVDLPNPPKVDPVQPIVERVFGLWTAPESHFWSDTLRVGPPKVVRDESVPHGPMVGEQAGWTRPVESDRLRGSDWTAKLRRTLIGTGIANPLDKSFATSGVLERLLCGTMCPPPPSLPEPPIFDGADINASAVLTLDARGYGNEEPVVYTGGDVYGQM